LIGFLLVILRGWHASNRLRHFIAKIEACNLQFSQYRYLWKRHCDHSGNW